MLGGGASICRQWRLKNDWGEEVYLLIILKKNKYMSTSRVKQMDVYCSIISFSLYLNLIEIESENLWEELRKA